MIIIEEKNIESGGYKENLLYRARHLLGIGAILGLKVIDDKDYFKVYAKIDDYPTPHYSTFRIGKKNGKIYDEYCSCYNNNICEHQLASLLFLAKIQDIDLPFIFKDGARLEFIDKRDNEFFRYLNYSKTLVDNMIDVMDENPYQLFMRKNLDMLLELNYDNHSNQLEIQVKIGYEKKYVVKNIGDLLNQIEDHSYVNYGKYLDGHINYNILSKEAKKVVNYLRKFKNVLPLKRKLKLAPLYIDEFFNEFYASDIVDWDLVIAPTNYHIEFEKHDYGYILDIENDIFLATASGTYQIIRNKLIKSNYETSSLQTFIKLFFSYNQVFIANEDLERVKRNFIYPNLKFLTIHGIELDQIEIPVIKIYGDIDDSSQIVFKVDEVYQENTYQAFDNSHLNKSRKLLDVEKFIISYSERIDYLNHQAILLIESDKTIEFIRDGLALLGKNCEIFISENLRKLGTKTKFNISFGVKVNNNLLELDIESLEIPRNELADVLRNYRKKKKYFRLKSGEVISLYSDDIAELDQTFDMMGLDVNELENDSLKVGLYRAFELDKNANELDNLTINRSEQFKELINNFSKINKSEIVIPENYEEILRDYQKFGFKWLKMLKSYGFGGILADDMGLGKTLQVIALLDSLENSKSSLVVCPSSLILNWVDEVNKFSSKLKVMAIYGSVSDRMEKISQIDDYDLIITSYDYCRNDFDKYDYEFEYLILDEAQYIKNKNTLNAKAVKSLTARNRLALTGTPIENSLAELWSIMDFLMPGYLYSYSHFKKEYEKDIVTKQNIEKQRALKSLVEPFILRRNKIDVLTELPDKVEHIIEFNFSDEEKKLYLANLANINDSLRDEFNGEKIDRIKVIAMLTRLRQLCLEPAIVYEDFDGPSSKITGCLEIVDQLVASKQKVLIFSSFTTILSILEKELQARGLSYFKLTGQSKKEERHRMVTSFQKDDTQVFLISLKAGGTGLNLTSASAVIHFDPWWNISAQNQATDRAYRIGQKNNVQEFKLIMKDSIEEKIIKMQEQKKAIADIFVENNEGTITNMSTNDLIELFK